jgi:hypothetical protein
MPPIVTSGPRRPIDVLLCALSCLWLAGCSVHHVSATRKVGSEVDGAKSILVSNRSGSVTVIRDPAATVMQVSAEISCPGETDEKAAARAAAATLTAARDEHGTVRISVDFPARPPVVVVLGTLDTSDDSADIVIRAADLDGIDISTANGSIDVGAFKGTAKLATSNGSIEVVGHAGPVDARSRNGAIRASGVRAPVVATTRNGRIEVALAEDAEGDVTLETSNSEVVLQLGSAWEGTVTADTRNGRADLSGGAVTKESGMKALTMVVGDAAKAKANVGTRNGSITVRSPQT